MPKTKKQASEGKECRPVSWVKYLPGFLISISLVVLLFLQFDLNEVIRNFYLLDWELLPLIFILLIISRILLSGTFKDKFVFRDLSKKDKEDLDSSGFERLITVVLLLLISITAMYRYIGFYTLILFIWLGLGLYLLFKNYSGKYKILRESIEFYENNRSKRKVIINYIALILIVQFLLILSQYTLFITFGYRVSLYLALTSFPLISVIQGFIPSFRGYGVQDNLYLMFFDLAGVPLLIILSASILFHIVKLFMSLIGGVLNAFRKAD